MTRVKTERIALALFTLGFLAWSAAFIYGTSFVAFDGRRYFSLFDDAMISMRFAWNFSHGHGLVWNAGEYVQGYTNLLMTLVMSLATLVFDKSRAVLSIQVLGIFTMLGIAFQSMRLAAVLFDDAIIRPERTLSLSKWQSKDISGDALDEKDGAKSFVRVAVFLSALAYYPLAYWSLMGMETGLLTLLFLSALVFAFEYVKNRNPVSFWLAAVCLGLAFLTRNDSLIFAVLIFAYELWDVRKPDRPFLGAIALYFLFVAGQFFFQYWYYGEVLPNTYALKLTGMPLSIRLESGIRFTKPFLLEAGAVLSLALLNVIIETLRPACTSTAGTGERSGAKSKDILKSPPRLRYEKHTSVRREEFLLLGALILSAIGYQVYVGGDAWLYWRLVSPVMPLVLILFVYFVVGIVNRFLNAERNPISSVVVSLLIVLAGIVSVNWSFLPELTFAEEPFQAQSNRENVYAAIALNEITTSGATVAVFWAGALPYYADRFAIDPLGKSDRYIASLPADISGAVGWNGMTSIPGHNKYDLNYSIMKLQPTYVQYFEWGSQDLSEWAETSYVKVKYEGIELNLLKDSPAVLWDKVDILK
ncbi:MAG: hypothetical protein HZB19_20675 [Chloroflexi bacterium]|nr:hypothetical protein [Chloroflexota bacterium]